MTKDILDTGDSVVMEKPWNPVYISSLCDLFGLNISGSDALIDGLNIIGRGTSKRNVLVYVTGKKYLKKIEEDQTIKAIIVPGIYSNAYFSIMKSRDGCIIIADNPEKSFYEIHEYLFQRGDFYKPVVSEKIVSKKATIHPTAIIEDNVIVEEGVYIGAYSIVKAGSIIGKNSVIGNHSVIGAEGFQVLKIDGTPMKIHHCGGVKIGERVEIGDKCTVCNTLFDGYTSIGSDTKIDNYCHIAHNTMIGERVIMTAGVTLTGSVILEDDSYIGAGATIMNKAVINQGAKIGIGSVILRDVKPNVTMFGNPAKQIL